jgi:hemolysin D
VSNPKPMANAEIAADPSGKSGSLGRGQIGAEGEPLVHSKSPAGASRKMQPADREFLPAALEILETPPSPIAKALIWFICIAVLAALAWSYFGWIDIHAVASGRIQASGRSKIVQPLEIGKVTAVHVANGSKVEAGDLLVELDATETSADQDAQARELEAVSAEVERRKTAIQAAQNEATGEPQVAYPSGTDEVVRRQAQNVLVADLAELAANRAKLKAQLAEKVATKGRLVASIAARERLIALTRERVQMRQTLSVSGAGSRALVIEAEQQLETNLASDVADHNQIIETEAAMVSLDRQIDEIVTRFIADQTQKLDEAQRKKDHLTQDVIKAISKRDRSQLRAPIAGTIQQLLITTVGQVVSAGQALMTVVPQNAPVEVEALVLNQDIGFVEVEQPVVVKVEAFPYTRYGIIYGVVSNVSRDGVDQKDANTLGDASSMTRPQGANSAPGSQTQQSLVFPATITLTTRAMTIDGKSIPLLPGMAVTVEIRTGRRRAIDFLLSPIQSQLSQAGHER